MRIPVAAAVLLGLISAAAVASPPPGGFWENDSSSQAYPPLTASQIAAFLPSTRTSFTFPSPYSSEGIRVTLPGDCPNSSNCVQYIGYSYWARMNNSAGSPFLYILVGLGTDGTVGPTIYRYDKDKNLMTKVGPLFQPGSDDAYLTGELMYFSYGHPYGLYFIHGLHALDRIDIQSKAVTQIFDIQTYNASDHIFQCSSSNNDEVHACTLEDANYHPLGCVVYTTTSGQFQFFPEAVAGGFDECHVGAGGTHLLIDEKTPQTCKQCDEDTVLVDLATGTQTIILNQDGGGGHYGMGYGYYIQAMNWDTTYNEEMLWNASDPGAGGSVVFAEPWATMCTGGTDCYGGPQHPSWLNAVPASQIPIAHQFACDGTSNPGVGPFANQVYCFGLDSSVPRPQQQSLVVAPTLVNQSDTGCAGGNYGQYPKGNIDFTGHYYIWSANLDSNNNCQVFIVRIPTGKLPYPPPAVTPPEVSISAPASHARVSGTVMAKADAWDNYDVSKVTWQVDGMTVGSSTSPPYGFRIDTNTLALGTHTLTAIAMDAAGQTATTSETVNVVAGGSGGSGGGSGGGGSLSLATLALLAGMMLLARAAARGHAGRKGRTGKGA